MSTDFKVSQENNNHLQKKFDNLMKEITRNKLELFNKENALTHQLMDCSNKLQSSIRNRKLDIDKDSDIAMIEVNYFN